MNISIFGLGYVGAVSLACLARDGHRRHRRRRRSRQARADPRRQDAGRRGGHGRADGQGRRRAATCRSRTTCARQCSTPISRSSASARRRRRTAARTSPRSSASRRNWAVRCATKSAPHVFVFRSTLVPGTVEDVLRPIDRAGVRQEGRHRLPRVLPAGVPARRVVDSRLRQAAVHDRRRERRGADSHAASSCSGICPCEFHATSIRAAEMVKYCCNNFHALKITFANETARLCEALGVDPFEVMDLVCQDTPAQHLARPT